MCVCVCVSIYIYIYNTHTHTHTHTCCCSAWSWWTFVFIIPHLWSHRDKCQSLKNKMTDDSGIRSTAHYHLCHTLVFLQECACNIQNTDYIQIVISLLMKSSSCTENCVLSDWLVIIIIIIIIVMTWSLCLIVYSVTLLTCDKFYLHFSCQVSGTGHANSLTRSLLLPSYRDRNWY